MNEMPEIWFWQRIITPHMMGLAVALSEQSVAVTYVAEERMSAAREQQGWLEPETGGVRVFIAGERQAISQLVLAAPRASVHICQGIRANGLLGEAQRALAASDLAQWVVMEAVRDLGWRGVAKRFEYSRLLSGRSASIKGVLAIGHRTPEWVVQRGMAEEKVFPFAYFLAQSEPVEVIEKPATLFRFIFVGRFIQLKRLDLLIDALGELGSRHFELIVIGSGPMEKKLRIKADEILGDKANWIGKVPSDLVNSYMAASDCLVLPSDYDGWGAVVSEALMCGTPVLCSDTCGSAGIVRNCNVGGVFEAGDINGLKSLLSNALDSGCVTSKRRRETYAWSSAISAKSGAGYLTQAIEFSNGVGAKPLPPWENI